ncbi:MAG: COG4315 family predicted lipoprotein [Gaiellales bacterium]
MRRALAILVLMTLLAFAGTASAATVTTRNVTGFGPALVDAKGWPLYSFGADSGTTSACYGSCATAWPPVIVKGKPTVGGRASSSLVGTIRRTDGTLQLTYGGRPMYLWYGDGPGVARCHNVNEFGGLWQLRRASGRPVP